MTFLYQKATFDPPEPLPPVQQPLPHRSQPLRPAAKGQERHSSRVKLEMKLPQ
ncbi:hypothetical protein EMPG_15553 [Blastomyces silverae]|uniref:Uncharacterized protein n=1 Tax=Blastomyces silverae TaxID=2060906 RepID=A0A0H1BDB1_9EURO|nr:hypothetical protein EMPG_15553 [Blastomyces silverae]